MNSDKPSKILPTSSFVKAKRKELGYTQVTFVARAGVGLNFLRDLEQGKKTVRMDKVNQVLSFFGYQLAPVAEEEVARDQ